jgi:hypothetical protein
MRHFTNVRSMKERTVDTLVLEAMKDVVSCDKLGEAANER